jgi:hypothetical protein
MDGAPLSLNWHFHLKIPIEYLGYGGTPSFKISVCRLFTAHSKITSCENHLTKRVSGLVADGEVFDKFIINEGVTNNVMNTSVTSTNKTSNVKMVQYRLLAINLT